ncbi:MAG: carboxylesterase family protein [Lachnospiraceae bacterium]|nr:carboxylesterase family protein [Lachnospiraceae bacterium]
MALIEAKTKYGIVRGVRGNNRGFTVFRGIPYAKPPVGELRFAPPQELDPWDGVKLCSEFGNMSVQMREVYGHYRREFFPEPKEMGEDCLTLHMWTPAEEPGEHLPVFLWIHGGGYSWGYSYEQEFDGEAMCKRGCILVSIGYRCNAFGFLAHPELTKRNGRSGNMGMEDQVLALRWVYENIAAFGGDPENITVHGQSAGAMSTRTLLTSPRCQGMIRHVILQSGGGINDWSEFRTMEEQEQIGVELLARAGLSFEQTMLAPAEELYKLLYSTMSIVMEQRGGGLGFHPCLDGYNLIEAPSKSILEGRINCDAIMCGTVEGDSGLIHFTAENDEEARLKNRASAFSSQNALGDWNARHGSATIYTYFFDHSLPGDELGSWHSCELWYMFGTMARCWRPWTGYDYVLSDAMVDYWCNFARSGNPNGDTVPAWTAYTSETPETMCFSDGSFGMKNLNLEPYAEEYRPYFQKSGRAFF